MEEAEPTVSLRAEFTKIESFSYFWNHLWTSDIVKKPKIQIVDTLLFSRGKPSCWLFTSQQTGEILRKRPEKLDSIKSILEAFKKKSQSFRGYKATELKSKIALVWFVKSDKTLSSFLASEKELGSILQSELHEVLAIQVFMGGFAFKGNGIFYHKIIRLNSGILSHQTYELIDSFTEPLTSQYTNKCKKLIVLESQSEILRNLGAYIVKYIELTSKAEVEYCTFQVSFNSVWDPYVIGVRDLTLGKLQASFFHRFEQQVYLNGIPPRIPAPNDESAFLPSQTSGEKTSVKSSNAQTVQIRATEEPETNNGARHALEIIAEDAMESTNVNLKSKNETVSIPPPDLSQKANYFKATNEDYSLRKDRVDLPFDDKNPLVFRPERAPNSSNLASNPKGPKGSTNRAAPLATLFVDKNLHSPNDSFDFNDLPREAKNSDNLFGATTQMVEHLMQSRNRISATLSNDPVARAFPRPKSASMLSSQAGGRRYQVPTDGYRHRTTFQGEDLDGSPRELNAFFKVRRPISAPHRADKKTRVNTLRRSRDYMSGSFDAEEEEDLYSKNINRTTSFNSYDTVDTVGMIGGSAFWKQLPLSGHRGCFGDYCWFREQCNQYLDIFDHRHVVVNNSEGNVYYTDHFNRTLRNHQPSSLPASAQVGFRAVECPYQIAYKSVLLARSETKFLGESLTAKVDSLVIRNKLANLDIEHIYTYFIRKFMNKVAQKCQEDARKFQVTSTPQTTRDWDDLNAVYRRIVYNDALATVHPSRFYYSVPVCECCYQIYLFLDQQREDTILHNPDQLAPLYAQDGDDSIRRPTSAATSVGKGRRPQSLESREKKMEERLERKKIRLIKEIEKFREEMLANDIEELELKVETYVASAPAAQRSKSKRPVKVKANTEFIPLTAAQSSLTMGPTESKASKDEDKVIFSQIFQPQALANNNADDDSRQSKRRPVSASAVLQTPAPDVSDDRQHTRPESAPLMEIKPVVSITSTGTGFTVNVDSAPVDEEEAREDPQFEERQRGEELPIYQYSAALALRQEQIAPTFSYNALPFLSTAPFLPLPSVSNAISPKRSQSSPQLKSVLKQASSPKRADSFVQFSPADLAAHSGSRLEKEKAAKGKSSSPSNYRAESSKAPTIDWDGIVARYEQQHEIQEQMEPIPPDIPLPPEPDEDRQRENQVSPTRPSGGNPLEQTSIKLDELHLSEEEANHENAPTSLPFDLSQSLSPISLFYFDSSLNNSN